MLMRRGNSGWTSLTTDAEYHDSAQRPAVHKPKLRPALMLGTLVLAFALSQAYRTLPALIVGGIGSDLHLTTRELGLFAGAFHFAFALLQLPVGIALDRFGPRRAVSALYGLACAGAVLSAAATSLAELLAGQILIGAGCSAALMGAMLFVSRWYAADRFAAISGTVVALGGLGMLMSSSPLAFIVEVSSWRAAYLVLALVSTAATVACAVLVADTPEGRRQPAAQTSIVAAILSLGQVLRQRQTPGILSLGLVSYAVVATLRGLWVGPYLAGRFGMGTVDVGNAVLGMSIAMIIGPLLFGRLDRGTGKRRALIAAGAVLTAASIAFLAARGGASFAADYAALLLFGCASSFFVLQFADARDAYAASLTGRALAMLNMAMFVGVAVMQWATGAAADAAARDGLDPLAIVLWGLAGALLLGLVAFLALPSAPRRFDGTGAVDRASIARKR